MLASKKRMDEVGHTHALNNSRMSEVNGAGKSIQKPGSTYSNLARDASTPAVLPQKRQQNMCFLNVPANLTS